MVMHSCKSPTEVILHWHGHLTVLLAALLLLQLQGHHSHCQAAELQGVEVLTNLAAAAAAATHMTVHTRAG
jgi:hypothetical protein